jgi:predicted AAA+ superfamily ATPase
MMEKITESLAGRTAVLKLLPLSRREAEGRPEYRLPWQARNRRQANPASAVSGLRIWNDLLCGSYPEPVIEPDRDIQLWHSAYVQTYLERDVRSMRQVGDLSQFQSFLRALAARSAQLLNLTELARDLGIAVNTAKAWISVLEAGYQIFVLRPYFANIGKRLVKTPKVYFTDTGTLCYLTGLKDPQHAAAGPMGGAIMETAVFSEIVKTITHQGQEPEIYFWRTSAGAEVDFVVPAEGKLVPIEVKLSATPRPAMARTIQSFQEDFGDLSGSGHVIHAGAELLPIAPRVTAIPFGAL